jgi:uncharacterized protein YjhX (UPF0386 family)
LRNLDKGGVIGFIVANDGRVGFDDDAVLLAVCVDGALLTPWVELYRKADEHELVHSYEPNLYRIDRQTK